MKIKSIVTGITGQDDVCLAQLLLDKGLIGIISFSGAPLRLALATGFTISGISLLYEISIFILALFGFIESQAGIPTIIVALFFFGGVQLFFYRDPWGIYTSYF